METINNFTDELLTAPLLVGIIFMITGAIVYCFPPKKINFWYGYRTPNSMQSEERWKFAQIFSAMKMIQAGIFLVISSALNLGFAMSNATQSALSLILIFAIMLVLFVITERAIKSKFPKSE